MTDMRANWTGEAGGVTNASSVTPDLIRGKQPRAARASTGLLRRLRRLAMTMEAV